ncbi:MAG: N,N-dimethylformamidase beta subunit family domain-containing protein, partial [Burkholderiaceae bacterium]
MLVVTSTSSTFGTYYAEILRTEGFNSFAVADIAAVTPGTLAAYDVVILARMPLAPAQVTMLNNWVNTGGNLIAMAPDSALAGLLGILPTGAPALSNGYLLVDTSTSPGNGIVSQTLQFHGTADRYNLNGAVSLATLYSSASTVTGNPALTLRSVGSGKAAAFTYDIAASVVYTRQGNPAWATQERDGFAPIRSDDKFYGAAAGDPQPDWIDLSKVAIPQADEQQRLLANLILSMNASKKPLPRFWYFPNGKKAVVIMSGDDHGNGGTAARFDQFKAASPAGCSLANWECVRGTSYIYPNTPLTDAQAAQYSSEGFEVGLHINTGCSDFDRTSLEATYSQELSNWQANYASLPAPITERHHCIVWSDWTTAADVQFNHGIRLDTSFYFWPPSWVNNVPGLFTGSAMPMRFARLDGSLVDVYMAVTQMTDESGQTYPMTIDTLLDRAIGPEGYFGVYTVNAHTDVADSVEANAVVSSALARGVPVVTARQMLAWLDGRNASSFGAFGWNGSALSFTVTRDPAANGLQAMLPTRSGAAALATITRGASAVAFTVSAIKGVEYALFTADPGSYVATYSGDAGAPLVTSTTPAAGATGVSPSVRPSATFSEAMDASTVNPATFELRTSANTLVSATVSYDAASRTATLVPISALAASATYTARLRGGAADPRIKDAAGNALASDVVWSFTTGAGVPPPTCPCGGWGSSAVPTNPSVADPNAVELGVKFRSDVNGFITGVRFYKGTGNTGTHIGSLWTSTGTQLATATFSGETGSGWQQVNFANPVAVTANMVYVASYFAPNGNYAGDNLFFANGGVDNPPIHLLQDGVSGGNGVYAYSSSSTFPSSTYQSSNYWVDVVFTTTGPSDTTPPTVTATAPINGATGVALGTAVTATFSEAVDAATLNSGTFELRTPASVLVAGAVSYDATTRVATFTPGSPLVASTTYTATLKGGATDPRVKDLAGNALAANGSWSFTTGLVGGVCGAPANPVVAENCLAGNPATEWDVNGPGDPSIQGFATQISVNRGGTVSFKVDTNATAYRFDIYRMGFYGGMGARKVASVTPSATLPQSQPNCMNDTATGLIDCGNWAVSGSWAIPASAVSGIYFAKLVRTDTGGASHIVFIVRNDASTSDLLFQTSDTTWQAYNEYGGNSLYTGSPAGRAYKVSYNRPFTTRGVAGGQDLVFNAEYPMVRWLEANGYDVSYFSGVDADRSGGLILNHRAFLSVGHDEYWSGGQRANVEAARAAGVNLAFFSGNEVFWKTRWENSIDGSGTTYRTLVTYKETLANAKIDPSAAWTGTWRDPRFSPP